MKIYLLNGHEAVVMDDRAACVTVEPAIDGVLSVDGQTVRVVTGMTVAPVFEGMGATHATFTTEAGIRYQVVSPSLSGGKLVSRVDPVRGYIEARLYVGRLEKRLETVETELRQFKGSIKHDSLGFLIKEEE